MPPHDHTLRLRLPRPRQRLAPTWAALVKRAALWTPSTVAMIATFIGVVLHEAAYHLVGGDDFPLRVLADDTAIFAISHGGLDALGVGAIIVAALALVEAARLREGRPR